MVLHVMKGYKASREIAMLGLFRGHTSMLLLFCATCWVNFLHYAVRAFWWFCWGWVGVGGR